MLTVLCKPKILLGRYLIEVSSGRFPREYGVPNYYFDQFLPKPHGNENKLDQEGSIHLGFPLPDSASGLFHEPLHFLDLNHF